jgi:hypothetical protein
MIVVDHSQFPKLEENHNVLQIGEKTNLENNIKRIENNIGIKDRKEFTK